MIQLLIHAWGDYLTQSDWMAQNKTKNWFPAIVHATIYSTGFLLLRPSLLAFAVILGTHYLIDRYRLARYVVWAKNFISPKIPMCVTLEKNGVAERLEGNMRCAPWRFCTATGYSPNSPPWLAFWLLIIADNVLHLTINYAALRWL